MIVHKDIKSPVRIAAGTGETTYKVVHPDDKKTYEYLIKTGYAPIYYPAGVRSTDQYGFTWELVPGGQWQDASLKNFRWHAETDSWQSGYHHNCSEYVILGYNGFTDFKIDANTSSPLGPYSKYKYTLIWSDNGENGTQGGCFSKKRDPSLDGKIISAKEFESCAWYYCPGLSITGTGTTTVAPQIITQNIDAEAKVTTDKTVVSFAHTDNLELSYTHNGRTKKITIPVYTETRNCSYNQQ